MYEFICRLQNERIDNINCTYVEFLCTFNVEQNQIELVSKSLITFDSILKEFSIENVIQTTIFCIFLVKDLQNFQDSSQKANLRKCFWLVINDFVPRGEFKPESIKNKSMYFNIEISENESFKVLKHNEEINCILKCNFNPLSLYHGSGLDRKDSILKFGVYPSFGMLGTAVYLGTFFKACRYAARHQNYEFRKDGGLLFRCLAFIDFKKICKYPLNGYHCACEKCKHDSFGFEYVSDHLSKWNTGPFSCAEIIVSDKPFGIKKTGEKKYLCKNSEWGFRKESVFVKEYLCIDMSSVEGPQYNPLQRNVNCIWN
jgi:hypothetical protein